LPHQPRFAAAAVTADEPQTLAGWLWVSWQIAAVNVFAVPSTDFDSAVLGSRISLATWEWVRPWNSCGL
jgi:hypothetical protein